MSNSQITEEPTPEMIEMYRLNRLMGVTQVQIAERFQVSQPSVSKYIRRAEEWLRGEQREEVDLLRTRITSRLEYLYTEAMQAWERSKQVLVVRTTKSERAKNTSSQSGAQNVPGETESTTIRETPQCGEVGFIRIAVESLNQMGSIWQPEMKAAERRGEIRAAGKTQLELIDAHLAKLQDARKKLIGRQ
jgi:predicted transcriptional regulator